MVIQHSFQLFTPFGTILAQWLYHQWRFVYKIAKSMDFLITMHLHRLYNIRVCSWHEECPWVDHLLHKIVSLTFWLWMWIKSTVISSSYVQNNVLFFCNKKAYTFLTLLFRPMDTPICSSYIDRRVKVQIKMQHLDIFVFIFRNVIKPIKSRASTITV